jgi:hypothetical protein
VQKKSITINQKINIQNYSSSAIDNIFIDSSIKDHISIKSVIIRLRDHDAQLLVIKNIESIPDDHNCYKRTILYITLLKNLQHTSNGNCESVLSTRDVN